MKKVILSLIALLSVFLTVSCTSDDYNENESGVENNTGVDPNGDINTTPPKKNG